MVERINMSDDFFHDAEEITQLYKLSNSQQIKELNDIIVMLRTKISYLEKHLEDEKKSKSIPAHISREMDRLKDINKGLKQELKERESVDVPRYYEIEFKKLMNEIERLKEDVAYYKSKVPVQVVINRENKQKPTRKGGIPR